jgi:hypothetical protein
VQPSSYNIEADQNDFYGHETSIVTPQANLDNLPLSSVVMDGQDLSQSISTVAFPIAEAIDSQIPPTIPIPQTPRHVNRCTEPPRDSGGNMVCNRDGCNSITFRTKSAWK